MTSTMITAEISAGDLDAAIERMVDRRLSIKLYPDMSAIQTWVTDGERVGLAEWVVGVQHHLRRLTGPKLEPSAWHWAACALSCPSTLLRWPRAAGLGVDYGGGQNPTLERVDIQIDSAERHPRDYQDWRHRDCPLTPNLAGTLNASVQAELRNSRPSHAP